MHGSARAHLLRGVRKPLRALLLLAVAAGLACSHLGRGADEAPLALREQAERAFVRRDWEAAWMPLRTLREAYPDHPETADAFPLAAAVYKRLYYRDRFADPDSAWIRSEPDFLFQWLESFYPDGAPEAQALAMLRGLPLSFARRFLAWKQTRPALARWELEVSEDNGIVNAVHTRSTQGAP